MLREDQVDWFLVRRNRTLRGVTQSHPNKSLDASGGGVVLNLLGAAQGALIRAAASTQTLCRLA
jgi:hypothetical protein